jgi:hypothetical protein
MTARRKKEWEEKIVWVKIIDFPLGSFSKLCLMVQVQTITFSHVALNVCARKI